MLRYRWQRCGAPEAPDFVGPLSAYQLRALVEQGLATGADLVALDGGNLWVAAAAWAELRLHALPPPRHLPERPDMSAELRSAADDELSHLRWWMRVSGALFGPMGRDELRARASESADDQPLVAVVGGAAWFPAAELFPSLSAAHSVRGYRAEASSSGLSTRCAACLEHIAVDVLHCPECGEPTAVLEAPPSTDDSRPRSWLEMHWRPVLTMGVMGVVLAFGIALRHLAPERYQPPHTLSPAAALAPACDSPCWHGEACEMGKCVWVPPNDVAHLANTPRIVGPFELPPDVMDVLPLDEERFAVSYLRGVQITSTHDGAVLSLVSDAPQAQRLHRVGEVVYATAPHRVYVIDAGSTRVLKSIELGGAVGELSVGASNRRVIVSLPTARAVVVIATDYHAEVSRFYFGEDSVEPIAIDDSGEHAIATNGRVPLPGLQAPESANRSGASYVFDPSRLPSEQDRVRTALLGNPVSVAMVPDASTSFVALRELDRLVELEHLPSGGVRQSSRVTTCKQPERVVLLRRGRRLLVGCNAGHAIEIFGADSHELIRRVPLDTRVSDVAITADGRQALIALPGDKKGAIGVLDLESYELALHELTAPAHRIRITPDGRTAVVVSDSNKVAWVIR